MKCPAHIRASRFTPVSENGNQVTRYSIELHDLAIELVNSDYFFRFVAKHVDILLDKIFGELESRFPDKCELIRWYIHILEEGISTELSTNTKPQKRLLYECYAYLLQSRKTMNPPELAEDLHTGWLPVIAEYGLVTLMAPLIATIYEQLIKDCSDITDTSTNEIVGAAFRKKPHQFIRNLSATEYAECSGIKIAVSMAYYFAYSFALRLKFGESNLKYTVSLRDMREEFTCLISREE